MEMLDRIIYKVCGWIDNQFQKVSDKKLPNVIVIMTDDLGYNDVGFNGSKEIPTPNIDRIAQKGVIFTSGYTPYPVCSPSRAGFITGRYQQRFGYERNAQYRPNDPNMGLPKTEKTIPEVIGQVGYNSGVIGKWHLGDNYPSRPSDQGFDESLIHLAGGMGQVGDFTNYFKKDTSYFDPILWHNNEQKPYQGYCSDIFTENAIEFIEKKLKIDDAIGAASVHGVAGVWGTLVIGLWGTAVQGDGAGMGLFNGGGINLLLVQALGAAAYAIWTLVTCWIAWSIIGGLFGGIRVSEEEETQGLDIGEHGMEAYPDFASAK